MDLPRSYTVLIAVAAIAGLVPPAAHATAWKVGFSAESGTPGGYVEVRENQIEGTPLQLRSDLGVATVHNLKLEATRRLGVAGVLHLGLASTTLDGTGTLNRTAYFNGTTLAPGPISSDTHFPDFLRFQADYWHRIARFGHGGRLWLSAGLTFVSLNFRISATVAQGSVGHETKEDFNTQELPVPIFGIHVRYPLTGALALFADFQGGHLPWTNSLRREGGMVQVTQTNEDAVLGLGYRFSGHWIARLYLYSDRYQQNERSAEDGNYVQINQHGIGLGIARRF